MGSGFLLIAEAYLGPTMAHGISEADSSFCGEWRTAGGV